MNVKLLAYSSLIALGLCTTSTDASAQQARCGVQDHVHEWEHAPLFTQSPYLRSLRTTAPIATDPVTRVYRLAMPVDYSIFRASFGESVEAVSVDGQTLSSAPYTFVVTKDAEVKVAFKKINSTHALDTKPQIYPNPTTGHLTVGGNATSARLYDLAGRIVRQWTQISGSELDLTELPAGTYILALADSSAQVTSHRIVKL